MFLIYYFFSIRHWNFTIRSLEHIFFFNLVNLISYLISLLFLSIANIVVAGSDSLVCKMLAHDISHPLTSYLSCNFNCFCNHKLLVNSPQFNIIEHNVKRFFSISPWLSGSTQNYYEILELSDNSSRKDIKKAFARLSKLVSIYI